MAVLPNKDFAKLGASFKSGTQLKSGIETFTLSTTKAEWHVKQGEMSRPTSRRSKEQGHDW